MKSPLILAVLVCGLSLSAFVAYSGDSEPTLPDEHYNYADLGLPPHLLSAAVQEFDNTPSDNQVTDAGATLGRVLFYDTRLSANFTISCASCHVQENAFADPRQFSIGFEGDETPRHSMGLGFARYYLTGRYFWDERAPSLEDQIIMPIEDVVEMGMTIPELIPRLEATTFYADLYEDAFGTPEITRERTLLSIAQFIRSMVAPNSKFDQGRVAVPPGPPGPPLPNFTALENQGMQMFYGPARCSRCHEGDLQVVDFPRNNGLDATTTDNGVGGARFKSNSLRNIELTAPYMHDGRFATLEDVIDFYSEGIQPHPFLDRDLEDVGGVPIRFNFTQQEKDALIAFLRTLTDESITTDIKWSDPFNPPTSLESIDAPVQFHLQSAYPNPFNPSTTLRFDLAQNAEITLIVTDLLGRRVATLADGAWTAGIHELSWDAVGVPSGVYMVRLESGGQVQTRHVTLLK